MSISYANLDSKQKQTMAKYWRYHMGIATGKIEKPHIEFNTLAKLSPEAVKVWGKFLNLTKGE